VPDMIGLEGASLPPDRATFLPLPLATKVAQVIPPYRSVSHFILSWQFFWCAVRIPFLDTYVHIFHDFWSLLTMKICIYFFYFFSLSIPVALSFSISHLTVSLSHLCSHFDTYRSQLAIFLFGHLSLSPGRPPLATYPSQLAIPLWS
jgi:hypothetical protein